MIIKSPKIVYLFDFYGTLFSDFSKLTLNPDKYDIRWHILTESGRFNKILIKSKCILFGLNPLTIITKKDFFTFRSISSEKEAEFKSDTMKNILNGTLKLDGHKIVEKIYYVDSNLSVISKINSKRNNLPFQAISMLDFKRQEFSFLL